MSTTPSADAKAVVKALAALTTQVRRLADTRQSDFVLSADATDDDATTTDDDGPRCVCGDPLQLRDPIDPDSWIHSPGSDTPCLDARRACDERGPWGDAHACIRPAGHPDDHEALDGCGWRTGRCGSGQHKPHPGFTCAEVDASQPYFRVRWEQEQQAPADDKDHTLADGTEASFRAALAADEDQTLKWARRESLLVLLTRLQRGRTLTAEEAGTLRQHVETEIREADTARSVAAGNKRHVQVMYGELEQTRVDLQAQAELRADVQRDRDQHAAVLREVLNAFSCLSDRPGGPPMGHVVENPIAPEQFDRWRSVAAPTVERPWWKQVAMYEKEAVEATRHVLELKAAIERVRSYVTDAKARYAHGRNDYEIGKHDLAGTILGALDGTEQPTTEA